MMLGSDPNRRREGYQLSDLQTLTAPQPQLAPQYFTTSTPATFSIPAGYHPAPNNSPRFGTDQILFDCPPQDFNSSQSQSLMPSESSQNWPSNGQLTPTSTTRTHNRGSSLSSLGSAGPASPFTPNTSNPQVVGDNYYEVPDFQSTNPAKLLTPAHTPSQENFYQTFDNNYSYHTPFITMTHDGLPRASGEADLMPAPEFNSSARLSIASVASHESPSTPPSYEAEGVQKNSYSNTMPKLERTFTDAITESLYLPYGITTANSASSPVANGTSQNQPPTVFQQRINEANSRHLSASTTQSPSLTIPTRNRSPFRHGSPLAPAGNNFGSQQTSNFRLNTATHMREQQKKANDERALQQQVERTSPEHSTPQTISPKDVDLIYHENEEDSKTPLFPPQQSQSQTKSYHHQPALAQEISESDDNVSHQSYRSMATTRRESSSAYSSSSQATPQQNFFAPPAIPGSVRQLTYPFVPHPHQQNLTATTQDFPATLNSMESSSSDYAPEGSQMQKPADTVADTGTYSCTYHGCTLRFDTAAKLQRHKREGHRNSAVVGAVEEGGMTSAAQRNSQAGPHKCTRINPSTGKPCDTIFSRPYDLTRHEDTIHNTRKMKVRCSYCREEKTFSRNDALTRHMRVVHPEIADGNKRRRGGGPHA